jgi:uncharacterized protein YbjT (DUF2867 family)
MAGEDTSTIAVVGATGCAGSRVVARLKARDVAVVEVSRGHGVDLLTGQGLLRALEGVDVVIDVSNPVSSSRWSTQADTLAIATHNLVGACAAREVRRLVVSTMACIEDPVFDGFPFYEAKRVAKEIALESPVPATIVKSTQWFEFATKPAAVTFGEDEVAVQDWLIQPIAADTVADVLVEAALGQNHAPRAITGPHPVRLPELTSRLLEHQGDGRPVRAVQPPIAALAAGALLPSDQAIVLGPDIDTWLRTLAPVRTDAREGRQRTDYSEV